MKIKIIHSDYSMWNFNGDVEMYIQNRLEESDPDALTEMTRNIERTQAAVGRLCDVLTEKGILDAQDLIQIADDYDVTGELYRDEN